MQIASHIRKIIWLLPALGALLVQSFVVGQEPGKVVPARAELSPLDQPIAWLQEGKRNYSVVKDYTCWLVSQERVKGELLEKNVVKFKMRTKPFSVAMHWVEPKKSKDQEVYFVEGRNDNKMRVKSPIFPNIIGFQSIDVNDPRVLQNSRHTILEAGIGHMIEQNLKHWEAARRVNQTKVTVGDFKYDNRECTRVELIAQSRAAGPYCCRTVIYLEKESKIPIRMENYDWPREGGTPGGDLLESFSYVGLQFNVGLKDADFAK
jgi:uncharacterized protein DUF1571